MLFRIAHHDNKTLFWHVAITHVVFYLMTGLLYNPVGSGAQFLLKIRLIIQQSQQQFKLG